MIESKTPRLITVAMPVFNGEKYIRQAIDSVLSQTFENFELIISDNCSTDATVAICKEFSLRDKRIRLIEQTTNRGAYWNFKYVTNQARGEFIAWLAHDDALDSLFLEECQEQLNANPSTTLVCCDFDIIDANGNKNSIEKLTTIRGNLEWRKRCRQFFQYPISNVYLCVYGMMRTSISQAILQVVEQPRYMAQIELPLLARFAAAGQILAIPKVLRAYRRHDTSLYHSELATIAKRARLARLISRHLHVLRLRKDQLKVLILARWSIRFKLGVLGDVLYFYGSQIIFGLSTRLRKSLRLFNY